MVKAIFRVATISRSCPRLDRSLRSKIGDKDQRKMEQSLLFGNSETDPQYCIAENKELGPPFYVAEQP
jgi:hypothetical protein